MSSTTRFLFVGEKPSRKALKIGARWETAQLAGRTLRDALAALGLADAERIFINLFGDDPEAPLEDGPRVRARARAIRAHQGAGFTVVGLGRNVQQMLERHRIKHLRLTHPAARGRIRRKELYIEHAGQVLLHRPELHAYEPEAKAA
jgi:hypothetical protein